AAERIKMTYKNVKIYLLTFKVIIREATIVALSVFSLNSVLDLSLNFDLSFYILIFSLPRIRLSVLLPLVIGIKYSG
ncbi:MAG: hypothetical protein KAJ34_05105, partial [Thermodesulfovibrionia bacterium]|nr:hypothetical protein [Thermodesulfovibrionia bacterium]